MEVRITKIRVRSDLPGCRDTEDSYFVLTFVVFGKGARYRLKKKTQ